MAHPLTTDGLKAMYFLRYGTPASPLTVSGYLHRQGNSAEILIPPVGVWSRSVRFTRYKPAFSGCALACKTGLVAPDIPVIWEKLISRWVLGVLEVPKVTQPPCFRDASERTATEDH